MLRRVLRRGIVMACSPPQPPDGGPLLAVVHEDAELLVVNKPAGLVCHPTKGDAFSSLISRVRLYYGAAPDRARDEPTEETPATREPTDGQTAPARGELVEGKTVDGAKIESTAGATSDGAEETGSSDQTVCKKLASRDLTEGTALSSNLAEGKSEPGRGKGARGKKARREVAESELAGAEPEPMFVNRLDRETGGLVVLSKTAAADRALKKLFEQRRVAKEYLAIVHGHVDADELVCREPLGPDEGALITFMDRVRPDGAPSETAFAVLRRFTRAPDACGVGGGDFTLLRAAPHSGRKHQIRLHLRHLGHPIVGDKLYGRDAQLYLDFAKFRLTDAQRAHLIFPCHALHSSSLAFEWNGRAWQFSAPPEPWFEAFVNGDPLVVDWSQKYL